MKIIPGPDAPNNVIPDKAKETEKLEGDSFANVLGDAMDKAAQADKSVYHPGMVSNASKLYLQAIGSIDGSMDPFDETEVTQRVDSFLDLFDQYQQTLGDLNVNVKDITPLITRLEAETDRLLPVYNDLPDGDSLKDVLNDVLVTSSVEIMKFRRGDYLAD